jgi:hypothetical protein
MTRPGALCYDSSCAAGVGASCGAEAWHVSMLEEPRQVLARVRF